MTRTALAHPGQPTVEHSAGSADQLEEAMPAGHALELHLAGFGEAVSRHLAQDLRRLGRQGLTAGREVGDPGRSEYRGAEIAPLLGDDFARVHPDANERRLRLGATLRLQGAMDLERATERGSGGGKGHHEAVAGVLDLDPLGAGDRPTYQLVMSAHHGVGSPIAEVPDQGGRTLDVREQ